MRVHIVYMCYNVLWRDDANPSVDARLNLTEIEKPIWKSAKALSFRLCFGFVLKHVVFLKTHLIIVITFEKAI